MGVFEPLLVGLIVCACAVFSTWRLLSVRLRLRTLEALSRLPAGAGGGLAMMLRRRTLAKLPGGCADCAAGGLRLSADVQPLNRKSAAPRR